MALKQTLVSAWLEQTSSTSQSNAEPSQITLHIMSHKPVLQAFTTSAIALLQ
jgi:hypothetical protein